ncbi:Tol-Pal system subunit TolR [Candidatus Trichorickettsia mobilis]|uniref:Tol-Pal system subunit TolR n=1 Tax=Candidatus Trichorickettsia mobilis TaxID=1346319 RepID=A0ABZ0UYZ7_9RICK|nr:protein TolR [Candidatus Trichorickettsia mobilis]WPY01304.1 Tol-Pal system subunit TolR [Candidatus Trichorickettsia mobilis]
MAFKLANTQYNRRGRRSISCEINITPLVDVMLVLLIIFMVTSPMLVAGINVDLPETKASPMTGQDEPLVLTINKKGELFLVETKIERTHIAEKLTQITKEKKDTRIFIRGDKAAPYGEIVKIIAEIHAAGFSKVALISNIKHNEK